MGQAAVSALAAISQYIAKKMSRLNTANLCTQQGVRFVPLVAESTGAWNRKAGHILLQISRSTAIRTGKDAGVLHRDLFQELCVLMRSHRARAVLRRRAELTGWEIRLHFWVGAFFLLGHFSAPSLSCF